jgi:6-phospho-3-hexuloisomerase
MSVASTLAELAHGALAELGQVFDRMADDAADPLMDAIVGARRMAVYGCGREGLQIRGFAMRLFHLGRDVHVVGDMTVPPLGPGDLLFVTIGPGALPTAEALLGVARAAGARTALITAQPGGQAARLADVVAVNPAQTMADDQGAGRTSVLPMGSLFETAQMILFELLILRLRERLGETAETMRARHTNLE